MCDVVSELGTLVAESGGWPELLPFLFDCVRSNTERLMTGGLAVFADLAAYATEALRPYLQVRAGDRAALAVVAACLATWGRTWAHHSRPAYLCTFWPPPPATHARRLFDGNKMHLQAR